MSIHQVKEMWYFLALLYDCKIIVIIRKGNTSAEARSCSQIVPTSIIFKLLWQDYLYYFSTSTAAANSKRNFALGMETLNGLKLTRMLFQKSWQRLGFGRKKTEQIQYLQAGEVTSFQKHYRLKIKRSLPTPDTIFCHSMLNSFAM